MPAPTVTWTRHSLVTTNGTSPSDIIAATKTAINACTHWETKGDSTEYVTFGPKGASPITNFRGILVGKDGGAPGSGGIKSPHNATNDVMYVGTAPDGLGTFSGTWDADDPTGGQRWSKYWKCSQVNVTDSVTVIESEEMLCVFFYDTSLDNYACFWVGCLLEPVHDDEGENSGRLYAMFTSGGNAVSNTFWNGQNDFMGFAGSGATTPCGGVWRTDQNGFSRVARVNTTTSVDDANTGYLTTWNGRRVNLPVVYRLNAAPHHFVGVLRQMKITQDVPDETVLQDAGSNDRALVWGSKRASAQDCLAFEQP